MGQITRETIRQIRASLANNKFPTLTAWEYEQLCRAWEAQNPEGRHRNFNNPFVTRLNEQEDAKRDVSIQRQSDDDDSPPSVTLTTPDPSPSADFGNVSSGSDFSGGGGDFSGGGADGSW